MQEDNGTTIRHTEGESPATRGLTDVLVGVAAAANTAKVVVPPLAGKIKEIFRPEPKPESPIIQVLPSYSQKSTDE
jgi:hypothetical protein